MERHRPRLGPTTTVSAPAKLGLVVGPAIFLAVFFALPVVQLLIRGLGDGGGAAFIDTLTSSTIRSAAWFTLWQAVVSTVLTLVLALPLTAVLANVSFRGRRLVNALVTVPFVLPTVVVAGAFIATSRRLGLDGGAFALERSVFAILVAHVFFNVAVVVRTVGTYWSQLSRDDEHAARVLGASALEAFVQITLRRLRPSLLAASSLVFFFTFTSFGIVLILGGARQRTIETEIFRFAISRTDFSTAAVLSVLQLLTVVALAAINLRLRGNLSASDRLGKRLRPARSALGRVGTWTIILVTLGLLAVPIAALVEQSLRTGDGFGFANYAALADRPPFLTVSPRRALFNSLGFAVIAAALATVMGGWASFGIVYGSKRAGRLLDTAYLLPLGTSAVTLGFGILITFDSSWYDIRQSWVIIPLAQSLIGVPFVTRAIVPALRAIDPKVREAAASMGANPSRIRRDIDLPIARRALAIGAGFAFAISLGEFGATSFVGRRPENMTVPIAISRLLSQPGETIQGQAMALSVILMVITAVVLLIVDRADGEGVL